MDSQLERFIKSYPHEKLMQTIPTGLFMVNKEMEIVYWNDEAERITGYPASEALGRHCSFMDGTPCNKHCGLFGVDVPKPITGIGCSALHREGHRIEMTKNIDLLYDADGEMIGGIEAFVDITRLKELQNNLELEVSERTLELAHEQRNLSAVLDGMTDLAYICTEDFEISFMNRAMQELFGEIENRKCYEVMHGLPRICDDCPLPQVRQGNTVHQERMLPISGRTYEIIHSPLYQADGCVRKLGVCRDITERLRSEAALKQANSDLDAFVATVSHDLRSPLTPLIGFSGFLLEEYGSKLDETAVNCLQEIESSGYRMQALLEDLLTLARVGELDRPLTPVPLNPVLDEVRQELSVHILSTRARIEIAELPALRVPESLLADLFRNLLRNSLDYAVGANRLIEVSGSSLPDRVQLRVVDHGPGVAPEERERIFEPFQRGVGGKLVSGTGIGLATVRKIVRLYDGQVRVVETPGGGATFIVDFFEETQE
jgi:PAS domain S-box-containing protein